MTEIAFGKAESNDIESHIDGLVAQYSVLGAARRKKRRRKLIAGALAAAGTLGLGSAAWQAELPLPGLQQLAEIDALRARLATELDAFSASRAELQQQRAWLEEQTAQLSAHLAQFERQSADLEVQRAAIQEQSSRLEAALAQMDAQRQTLLAAAEGPGAVPAQAIAALDEEQRALEDRRQVFAAQQDEVSLEIETLTEQREALETRRQELEAQRRELEALLNLSGRGLPEESEAAPSGLFAEVAPSGALAELAPSSPEPDLVSAFDPWSIEAMTMASVVDSDALGEMRGGIMLGDGMNVSIGLTRSADINGVEQISNTLSLDGLNGLSALPVRGLESIVIQNGPNNSIASGFLDGMSSYGTILQNSLDNQTINTRTIFDISIQDVSSVLDGVAAGQALRDSLYLQQ